MMADESSHGGDDISDIISIGSDVRDLELVNTGREKKKRGRRTSSKKELVL
jgi:hypothetical protein